MTLRTLGVVTVVTGLIWVLAESQTLQRRTVTVSVTLDSGGGQRVIRVVPSDGVGGPLIGANQAGWDGVVDLTLEGAAGSLSRALGALRSGVTLAVGDELGTEPGVRSVDLRDVLRRDEALSGSGVSLREVRPAQIGVEVRELVERVLPVQVVLPEGTDADVTLVDPAAVTVRGPSTVLADVVGEATAAVAPVVVRDLVPGQVVERTSTGVEIAGLGEAAWGVGVSPERVSVSVRARSRVDTVVVPAVPIQVLLAPSELERWVIELAADDRDVRDVRVTGPVEQVARVASGEVRLVAVVRLSFEELERGVAVKDAELVPPAGSGLRMEADDVSVRLTVTPRDGAGSDG